MNILTFVKSTKRLITEIKKKYPDLLEKDEDDNITGIKIFHTPVIKKNKIGTLAYTMVDNETLNIINNLKNIENLGDYDEMEADPKKRAKYLSIWDYETPIKYTDENDKEQEYYRPKKIGTFAGDN